jgi:hypothetical protein
LRDQAGSLLASNDNWRDTQTGPITSTGIPPSDDLESAILAFLKPGAYTAIVRGNNNTTGVALVEVYDLGLAFPDTPDFAKLANIATRGLDTGDNVMIGGFRFGSRTQRVVRAIGPSLSAFGISGALPSDRQAKGATQHAATMTGRRGGHQD